MAQINTDLETLKTARDNMKSALEGQGQTVTKDIRTYAQAISNISGGGEVKLFDTIAHMQSDPTAQDGDLAIVYREETQPITGESEFDSCIFPNEVVLDTAITSTLDGYFIPVSSSTGYYCEVRLSQGNFIFSSRGGSGSDKNITYTSSDGITYTRADGGNALQEFEASLIWASSYGNFNSVFGNFINIGTPHFEGFYKYSTYESNKAIKLYFNATRLVDDSTAKVSIKLGTPTSVKVPKLIKILQEYLATVHKENYSFIIVRETDDIYNVYMTNLTYTPPNITPLNDRVYITRTNSGSAVTSMTKVTINLTTETYNYQDITYTKIWESGSYWIGSYEDITDKLFTAINIQNGIFNCDTFSAYTVNYAGTGIYGYSFPMELGEFTDYNVENAQLNASDDYVYDRIFFGEDGVGAGNIADNISNYFYDITAEIFGKAQIYYNTLSPRILTNQDKTITKDIRFIPSKSDGTSLLDTSNVTDMGSLFEGCKNLIGLSAINTNNATTMFRMFKDCISLITIPQLNTSNVTVFQETFMNCHNLKEIPSLDLSSVANTQYMFYGCSSLTTLQLLNTNNIINMQNMFNGCVSLTTLPQFNISNATHIPYMFYKCTALTTVPLLNVSSATNMQYMFGECPNLSNVSLNNILQMCVNATAFINQGTNLTLKYIGLSQAQATICQGLSNYQDFINAGWTTGY